LKHLGFHLILLDARNAALEESIELMKSVDMATVPDTEGEYALDKC